jgi:UDP-2-acetamido-2-deoxy-ribo-hexuluronate aminotransferase
MYALIENGKESMDDVLDDEKSFNILQIEYSGVLDFECLIFRENISDMEISQFICRNDVSVPTIRINEKYSTNIDGMCDEYITYNDKLSMFLCNRHKLIDTHLESLIFKILKVNDDDDKDINVKEVNSEREFLMTRIRKNPIDMVMKLERALEKFVHVQGIKQCVCVSNSCDGLELAFRSVSNSNSIGRILVPAFSHISTANAVASAGLNIGFMDLAHNSFLVDHTSVLAAMTPDVIAVCVLSTFGHVADFCRIRYELDAAGYNDVLIIEDASQSFGSAHSIRDCFVDIAVTSFYHNNILVGDGGGAVFARPIWAQKVKVLANHGRQKGEIHVCEVVGRNSRMGDLEASLLIEELKYLNCKIESRRFIGRFYMKKLVGISNIKLPFFNNLYNVPGKFTIMVDKKFRDSLFEHLKKNGICAKLMYSMPVQLQPCWQVEKKDRDIFKYADNACSEVISLPVHPFMKICELKKVVNCIKSFYNL